MSNSSNSRLRLLQRVALFAVAITLVGGCREGGPQAAPGPPENLPTFVEELLPPGSQQILHEVSTGERSFEWWLLNSPEAINWEVDMNFDTMMEIPVESVLALVHEFAEREIEPLETTASLRGWHDQRYDYRLSGILTSDGWYYRLEVIEN